MTGLLSTGASRAWLGVAVLGAAVVAVVVALQLMPRMTAGQAVLDAAKPAIGEGAVKGEVAATKLTSQYVDLADPLVTAKGDGAAEVESLIQLIARRTQVSNERARAFLRRAAPHTEALLRALPFSAIANERDDLTTFLSNTLVTNPEALQDQLARDYPRLFQTLAELPALTGGWYDVPGIEGLQLFDGTPVRTFPGFRRYLRDDLVATIADEQEPLRNLAGSGGIGYIPYLLLIVGLVAIGFGLLHASWSRSFPPSGKRAWAFVAAIGVLLLLAVGALQYFPRLDDAQTTVTKLQPAFEERQVAATRAGVDLVVQAVRFGDPIMTKGGGAATEVPRLVSFVATQTGQTRNDVRSKLARAAPRTAALLEAMPLRAVGAEVPKLLPVLARKLGMSEGRLVSTLRERTPKLAQALLSAGPLTAGWTAIPGTEDLTRLDGVTPVRTMPQFAEYLDQDIVPLLETQREHVDELADPWPPLDILPGIVVAIGVLLAIYGTAMMFLATTPARR